MRKTIIITSLLLLSGFITLAWLSETGRLKRYVVLNTVPKKATHKIDNASFKKLQGKASEAGAFIRNNKYNSNICFLIDMSLPSGQNRFFVYDLIKDTIKNAGLVTHGNCNQYWLEGRKYGNTVGCGCSSLGKYKVGNPYTGKFGLAYKLYGLDKTNDNAFARFVVLHGHGCVPNTEITDDICQSNGCPTVSPSYLQYLKPIINASSKPVLLWIYE
ncbi:MAG TPA: murein L,D-transpeptidase catalytic domain family protein [Chitinophagaceae bacterium]